MMGKKRSFRHSLNSMEHHPCKDLADKVYMLLKVVCSPVFGTLGIRGVYCAEFSC